jgi:glycosyltransferase involved in cell wall biosynthesis
VRLLHIITNRFPATPDDQASPFVRDFVSAVSARGIEVEVTSPCYSATIEEPPGIRINWLPWRGSKEIVGATNLFNPLDALALGRFLLTGRRLTLEVLKRRRADHCLALWALPSGWFALEAKRRLGVPYSVWCLGSDINRWATRPVVGRIVKTVLSEANHLFADGHELCEKTEELSGRRCRFLPSLRLLPKEEILSGRAATEPAQTATGALAQPGKGQPEHFDFLYVGRLEKNKGVFQALDAFAIARSRARSISLSFLGWGPDERSLKTKVEKLGLADEVRFLGVGGPREVARAMAASQCLLIPSLSDSIPLVFGEALQAKIPLIVTDVGDMGELTSRHDLGLVVAPGDAGETADAMLSAASGGPPPGYPDRMDRLLRTMDPGVAADTFLSTVCSGKSTE